MIRTIVKRELKRYFKNAMFYFGAVIVFFGIYYNVSPYLDIGYFQDSGEIKTLDEEARLDNDIMDGYIPTTKWEQYEMGFQNIHQILVEKLEMTGEEADAIIDEIKTSEMSIEDIDVYLENNYSFLSARWYFYEADRKQATVDEANEYIEAALSEETYTSYFARKYVDYLSVYIVFYAILMLAFLFFDDSKKDVYELLHTKPFKPWQYIMGKVLGGTTAISLVVIAITTAFTGISMYHGVNEGFPVSVLDLWWVVLIFIVPIILVVTCVYTLIAVLFKNPLPAVPLLVLYAIYSNLLGVTYFDGVTIYQIPKLAILIRFPNAFFETSISAGTVVNQMILFGVACLFAFLSITVWKRRRVY